MINIWHDYTKFPNSWCNLIPNQYFWKVNLCSVKDFDKKIFSFENIKLIGYFFLTFF